jgi:hypothetical protein
MPAIIMDQIAGSGTGSSAMAVRGYGAGMAEAGMAPSSANGSMAGRYRIGIALCGDCGAIKAAERRSIATCDGICGGATRAAANATRGTGIAPASARIGA